MANLPKKPLEFKKSENFYYSIHELSKSLYALVISNPRAKGSIELSSLNFFATRPEKNVIARLAPSNTKSIQVPDLFPQISNNARRELLTGHVFAYFFGELKNVKYFISNNSEPRNLYDDVVAETAEIYKILSNWGEPAAAQLLAKFENISVRTIQNRLRLAREKGLLAQPGSGKRFS